MQWGKKQRTKTPFSREPARRELKQRRNHFKTNMSTPNDLDGHEVYLIAEEKVLWHAIR